MDSPGDEVLPRAAFSGYKDCGSLAGGYFFDQCPYVIHGRGIADYFFLLIGSFDLLPVAFDLIEKSSCMKSLLDDQLELSKVKRLGNVMKSPEFRRRDSGIDRTVSSYHYYQGIGIDLLYLSKHVHAVYDRELVVEYDKIGRFIAVHCKRLCAVGCCEGIVPFVLKLFL